MLEPSENAMPAKPVEERIGDESAASKERNKFRSTNAKEVFLAAADLPAEERVAYLDRACSDDTTLRGRVEALLRAHDEPGSFPAANLGRLVATLDSRAGAAADPGKTSALENSEETLGANIGPYKLLQRLGEGGMGAVYMAEQTQPVRRMVALKIIREGLDSRQIVARFEAERQALALMDHPNIARVLDAGTTASGRPFFAMELVKGIPITRFCDEQHLSPRERLKLFISVCQAVQHAHQKGIIHRDLKPSNVLVALYDDRPVPKVIDFGVAKATSQKLTDRTMFTEFGSVVGTLEYMSPEQAKLNALDVDTRSDIYALGVLIYELLTGTTPLERKRLKDSALDELLRVIREEEPPLPSTRLTQVREQLPSVAAQRQTEPARLAKLIRGDLDWIVMKALEKDRSRRYETASDLAQDIERYLNQQPVEACPPSTSYRVRKFLRRNRGPVLAGALLLLALLGGIAGTSWGLIAASQALTSEQEQRNIAERAAQEKEKARNAAEIIGIAAAHERDQKEEARAAAEKALYFNRVNLAFQYWQANNFAQSRRMLDLCAPVNRGWEWRYLDRIHHADLETIRGNGPFETKVGLSKDGKRLTAFNRLSVPNVRVLDVTSKKQISLIAVGNALTCAAPSADGERIALGDQAGAITIWNAETGRRERELGKLTGSVSTLTFSADGRMLAAARADFQNGQMLMPWMEPSRNEELIVFNLSTGKEVFHPKGYGYFAEFSPSGSRLVTLRKNRGFRPLPTMPETTVALFDTNTWSEIAPDTLGPAICFSFSSNGKWLAIGGFDPVSGTPNVRLVNQATGDISVSVSPTVGGNFDLALNSDGTMLALTQGIGFGEIDVWDLAKRQRVRTLRGHLDTVNSLAFSPKGTLISSSSDNTIKIWDPNLVPEVRQIVPPAVVSAIPAILTADASVLAYSENGTVSLLTGPVTTIDLVELDRDKKPAEAPNGVVAAMSRAVFRSVTGTANRSLDGNALGVIGMAASADGKRLVSAGRLANIMSFDLTKDALLCTYRGHSAPVSALAISADGHIVASAEESRIAALAVAPKALPRQDASIDSADHRTRASAAKPKMVPQPPTTTIPTVGQTPPIAIKFWDTDTGQDLFTLPGPKDRVYQLAFSRDDRWLAIAGLNTVQLWDVANRKLLRELNPREMYAGASEGLLFCASGDLLATSGANGVQIWDVATGRSLALLQGHRHSPKMAFSPDGSRMATSAGRLVKLWDVRTGQEALTLPLPQAVSEERAPHVVALAYTADGQRLRAALRDGSVVEWDATPKP
jgi:serine/threonine protein kinase/WD40 repeat protein